MEHRILGSTGIKVSAIGLGSWATGGGTTWGAVDDQRCIEAVRASLDAGVTLVDTAPVYGGGHAEEVLGKALSGRRDSVVLATKCGLLIDQGNRRSLKPADLRRELGDSLRRLHTDRIDIYLCHWPDPGTQIEDTMAELVRMKKEGLIRAIGLSNHPPELVRRAHAAGPVDCLQEHLSLLSQDALHTKLPLCAELGMGFMAYGPLGGGILTGKYAKRPTFGKGDARNFFYPFYKEPHWTQTNSLLDTMRTLAAAHHTTPAAVAIAWVNAQAGVTVSLVGAKNAAQAAENVKADGVALTADEKAELARAGGAAVRGA